MEVSVTLTVFFDDPFWVGVCEREAGDQLEAFRIVFGSEPKDYEVLAHIMERWSRFSFSPPVAAEKRQKQKINPKRMQRSIQARLEQKGASTKAQAALQAQRELLKTKRKKETKENREEEADRLFQLRQQKKKEKHKGR